MESLEEATREASSLLGTSQSRPESVLLSTNIEMELESCGAL